jgi:hypothetical protein
LTALVLALGAGLTIDLRLLKPSLYSSGQSSEKATPEDALDADERRFYEIGKEAWVTKNQVAFEARKRVVVGIIEAAGSARSDAGADGGRGWCDEQVWARQVGPSCKLTRPHAGYFFEACAVVYSGAGRGLAGSGKGIDGYPNGNYKQVRPLSLIMTRLIYCS